MFREISLTDLIETHPVVTTGARWTTQDEAKNAGLYYRMFPECKRDPLRNDVGNVDAPPAAFSKGGGFFPVLVLMDDGRLCCSTRTGAPHVGSGGEISVSFSDDKGVTWSDYEVVVRGDPENDLDLRNQSIGQADNGDLVLAYGVSATGAATFGAIEVVRSCGEFWSEPMRLPTPPGIQLNPHGQMRRLPEGDLVFNARGNYEPEEYERDPDLPLRMTYLYWSRDGGKSWEDPALIGAGWTETGFLPLADGEHWVAYVRSNEKANRIAHSYDGGKNWTRWEIGAFSEGAEDQVYGRMINCHLQWASPGSIAALPNGKVLITYGYRAYPFGVRAIVSEDGGGGFDISREYILSDTGYHPDCGYPSTVCFDDGTVVTTAYTIKDIAHPEWGTSCLAYCYHQDVFD